MKLSIKTTEIKTVKHLRAVLGCKLNEIEEIIANIDKYYYEDKRPKTDKNGNPKYKNGQIDYRIFYPSLGRLKTIQEKIQKRILSQIVLLPNIKGGVKGFDNVANAKAHLGKKYKFKTDIKRYFPSIDQDRVHEMFIRNGFSAKVSSILTHLTTYKYELPQGTPTSTPIANLVFVPHDLKLIELCKEHKITYTRFVDDLVFSSPIDFRIKCNDIVKLILGSGFKISYKKTIYRAGNMEITGVLTKNNVLDVMDEFKTKMKDTTINPISTMGRLNYYNKVRAK